jgi:alkylation response protein AidB-like acyl-CoA dehydrogenase
MAWAFCAGYQAALRAMVPSLPDDAIAAFCASEEGGNAPKAIRTELADAGTGDGSLPPSGLKQWTTLGPASAVMLVVGTGWPMPGDTRPMIRVARIAGDAPGSR